MTETTHTNLRVLNGNDFTISDRFDGVPYEFEPGKALTIPPDAAAHMLGWYPGADPVLVERHVQKRWGWNTPEMAKDAPKFFRNLTLTAVRYRMIEVVEQELEDELPALPPKKKQEARAGATA